MYSIEIKGTSYPLRFGMGFVNEMNKRESVPVDGMPTVKQDVGLSLAIARMLDGDLEALADIIFEANRTEQPRIERNTIYEYFEDDSTDIQGVFEKVLDFLKTANCTKLPTKKMLDRFKEYEEQNQ